MPTLIDIGNEMQALMALLNETDGELNPETEKALDAFFAEISADQNAKVDGYCALVRQEELLAAARRSEVERLQKRVAVGENFAKHLKQRLKDYMERTGQAKIETRRYKVSVAGNGGKLPVNVSTPPDQLPPEFQRQRIEADTDKIRAALEAGQAVPGARLESRGTHLRIT